MLRPLNLTLSSSLARQISQAEIDLLESTKKPRKFVHFRLQELILRFNLKTEHYLSVQQLLSGAGAFCLKVSSRYFFPRALEHYPYHLPYHLPSH